MSIMAKKEANRRAATLPSPSKLNELHRGVGFVSDYASGAKVSATSEELAAAQVCARRPVEGTDTAYPTFSTLTTTRIATNNP